jgi:hypothetical protein
MIFILPDGPLEKYHMDAPHAVTAVFKNVKFMGEKGFPFF